MESDNDDLDVKERFHCQSNGILNSIKLRNKTPERVCRFKKVNRRGVLYLQKVARDETVRLDVPFSMLPKQTDGVYGFVVGFCRSRL